MAVNPTANRVYVANNGTSAKPSTTVSVLDGTTNAIATTVMPKIGDITAYVGGSTNTSAVTGNASRASASLGKPWSAKNVMIGQAGVGKQLINSFIAMADAMLAAIGLVYLPMVIVFR